MVVWTNIPANNTTYTVTRPLLTSGNTYNFLFMPCARTKSSYSTSPDAAQDMVDVRTQSTVYVRGIKERISCITDTRDVWRWRRIVFTLKGQTLLETQIASSLLYAETTGGYRRVVNGTTPTMNATLESLVFKGAGGVDWLSVYDAKVDTTRISVVSDKNMLIKSGNDGGTERDYRFWYPFGKNLVYSDDESGGGEIDRVYSTQGKPGMGDVYIADWLSCRTATGSEAHMYWTPQATFYWHER